MQQFLCYCQESAGASTEEITGQNKGNGHQQSVSAYHRIVSPYRKISWNNLSTFRQQRCPWFKMHDILNEPVVNFLFFADNFVYFICNNDIFCVYVSVCVYLLITTFGPRSTADSRESVSLFYFCTTLAADVNI